MGVISGIRGLLNGISRFETFSVTSTANLQEVMNAATGGGSQRFAGTQDWNGTYQSGGVVPDHFPGDTVAFLGSIDGSVGLSGNCLITQVVITIPVSANTPITHAVTFRGVGALTPGPAVVSEPSPGVMPDMPKGICVALSPLNVDTPVFTDEPNCTNIVITLTINPQEYVDCGTDGDMYVEEGSWDATVAWDRNVDDFTDLPGNVEVPDERPGGGYYVRVPVDDVGATYYEFQWMRIGEFSNMQVNRNGDLVSASIPASMSTLEEIGLTTPTVTSGQVLLPGGSVWRPAAPAALFANRLSRMNAKIESLYAKTLDLPMGMEESEDAAEASAAYRVAVAKGLDKMMSHKSALVSAFAAEGVELNERDVPLLGNPLEEVLPAEPPAE